MPPLYLLEPTAPGAAWMPFTGVRPICELRAGAWRIRERWEGVLGHSATAILGTHVVGFHELDEPPIQPHAPVTGPAVVCRSDFAPSGHAPDLPEGTRRLVHEGTTVAWIVPDGVTWSAPHDDGKAAELDGILLQGAADLVSALELFLPGDVSSAIADVTPDRIPDGTTILGDPGDVVLAGAQVEPGVVFDV
ncbi:MAG TPA: putative sugar nucleotidyl transferase, partial [Gemmatimonadales bacterium]|nr:putative sugar nucleotidyl transferase [Gemmatimonadales bacterium]